mmetsp:Transcript_76645/g.248081  ORF Transcript_76645/g.248081 Transcript_76645/m.248081 type:complete len:270 (-) Transcript_76645:228-1037(-)
MHGAASAQTCQACPMHGWSSAAAGMHRCLPMWFAGIRSWVHASLQTTPGTSAPTPQLTRSSTTATCLSAILAATVFDLRDTRCWLTVPLDPSATSGARFSDAASPESLRLYSSRHNSPFADLRPRCWGLPVESESIEESIEHRLAGILQAHREAAGLSTRFDDHLSQLLQVALVNCELERATGVAGSSTFEDIMRRYCDAEEVLQAVPVQFNHLKVSHYWPMLSDRPTVRTLLAAPAASTAFALRARVVPYPEGVVAVWVLLAAVGRSA